jgi:hypothetical protein
MHRRFVFAILISAHALLSGAASLGEQNAEPPLSPEGEPVMNDPDTAAYCIAHARDVGERLNTAPETAGYFDWTLGAALVTHNENWGIVCRIDFTMAGQDVSPRLNRIVLYAAAQKLSVMIAIGQHLEPLDPPVESLAGPLPQ